MDVNLVDLRAKYWYHFQTFDQHLWIALFVYNVKENQDANCLWNGSVILNAGTSNQLKCTFKCMMFMENMQCVMQWYRDGCDFLMKVVKMCMMMNASGDGLY